MEYNGASFLHNTSLLILDTKWDNITGNARGAKHTFCPPWGVLLHGLPRCTKKMLVRAAAGVEGITFLSLGPADMYPTLYVGNAEAAVRRAFNLARLAAPCVLFFDEINTIVNGGDGGNGGSGGNWEGHGMGHGLSA
jgi:SpoVK/Ycf46/Vps4 family AAA+-type ATPase